jgi:hypothetical protein
MKRDGLGSPPGLVLVRCVFSLKRGFALKRVPDSGIVSAVRLPLA